MTHTHFNAKVAAKAVAMLSVALVALFAFAFIATPVVRADDGGYGSTDFYGGGGGGYGSTDFYGGGGGGYGTTDFYGSNSGYGTTDYYGGSNGYYGDTSSYGCGSNCGGSSSYGSTYGCGSSCGSSYYPPTTYTPPVYNTPTYCTTCNTYRPPVTPPPPVVPPVTIPQLSVSCSVSGSSVHVGDTVVWYASVSGATGNYTYNWSGTDGLSSGSQTVSKQYSTPGSKSGSVTVTSGNQTRTADCGTVSVQQVQNPPLQISCMPSPSSVQVNNTVVWTAQVSGADGNYSYAWSGSDGLSGSGSSVTKLYSASGSKTAQVTVTAGDGQSQVANCGTAYVQQVYNSNPVTGSCSVLGGLYNIPTNSSVTWIANASGGDGNYTYTWTGTDGLYSNTSTANKYYTYGGSKYASVTIYSAGQQTTVNCGTIYVNDVVQNLNVSCYANPSVATVGQTVAWTATVNGGNNYYNNNNYNYNNGYNNYGNNYTFSWTGTDGLSGGGSSLLKAYSIPGLKTAAVTVYGSNGQPFTQQCSNSVQVTGTSNVTVYSTPGSNQLSSAVYLSQVPYTGLADSWKVYLYLAGLMAFSAGVTWAFLPKKKKILAA